MRFALLAALFACATASADDLASARYADPVERYGHFAVGRPHEYARLAGATIDGRAVSLELPDDEVFEDVAPRLIQWFPGGTEAVTIVSKRGAGSRLAIVGLADDRLRIVAQSMPIGTAFRWLNPIGVGDLGGDGRAEIAVVVTPHVDGRLEIYRREGAKLVPVASLGDVSNHVYGTTELALSAIVVIDGRQRIAVPDRARRVLRIVAFDEDRLREIGRCALADTVTGPLRVGAPGMLRVGTSAGVVEVALKDCR